MATDLTRIFGKRGGSVHALGPLDLAIGEGQFVCLVGPSGCGKTTFLRIAAGTVNPTSGRLRIHQTADSETAIAMVFQEYSVYPWKTVRANVRLGLDLAGVPRKIAGEQAEQWLERMQLLDFASEYPSALSGGMLQRVAIARALAVEPDVLLMDEPFAALDAQLRLVMQEELLTLWEQDRRTVVFVTHSLDEAILLGDRIVVMSARPGQIIRDVTVPFARPRPQNLRGTPEFAALREDIWTLLRNEVESAREIRSP